jgi:zinc transport system permease protein
MALAMLVGLLAAGSGVVAAAEADTAPGATIVIVALAGFVALTAGGALSRRLRGVNRKPVATEPPDVVLHG